MKKIVIITSILFLLVFIRCCVIDPEYSVDPKLQPYVDTFRIESANRGIELPKDLQAYFGTRSHGGSRLLQHYIEINRKDYDYYLAHGEWWAVEGIIFHELGHAWLRREHAQTVSVMNYDYTFSSLLVSPCVRQLYWDELFLRRKIDEQQIWTTFNQCEQ